MYILVKIHWPILLRSACFTIGMLYCSEKVKVIWERAGDRIWNNICTVILRVPKPIGKAVSSLLCHTSLFTDRRRPGRGRAQHLRLGERGRCQWQSGDSNTGIMVYPPGLLLSLSLLLLRPSVLSVAPFLWSPNRALLSGDITAAECKGQLQHDC